MENIKIPESANIGTTLPDPAWLSYYSDLDKRIIWLLSEISEAYYDVVAHIIDWNREDKDIPVEERKPIKFILASPGGSLEVTKTISETITLSKTPVIGIAIGLAASGASMIFLSCHKKYAYKNVTFLLHQGSCEGLSGNYAEMSQFMENYKRDISEMTDFYIAHTSIDPDIIRQKLREGDWYINTPEALEFGLIDEIISSMDIFM